MDDPAYKRLLTHRRIVWDLLIGFIAPLRPAGWADALDFATLRDGATENVTDALRRRLGDVVWSIDRSDGHGGVQTLHVVIEHQSRVDYSMPLWSRGEARPAVDGGSSCFRRLSHMPVPQSPS